MTYAIIYAVMNLGAFAVVIAGARKTGTGEMDGWAASSYRPGLGLAVALFFSRWPGSHRSPGGLPSSSCSGP